MFKYFHIIKFLMTHDLTYLKECWEVEILNGKKFKWSRLFRYLNKNNNYCLCDMNKQFSFRWRLANEMFIHGGKTYQKLANKMQREIISNYNVDISLGCKIGKNFYIGHFLGIAIAQCANIGENFHIRQNSTVGIQTPPDFCKKTKTNYSIKIGDNVSIGMNSCIMSDNIEIGSNVIIGAMSFVNKNIPDNCTVYTEKTDRIIVKN